jgi:hypothetical protein
MKVRSHIDTPSNHRNHQNHNHQKGHAYPRLKSGVMCLPRGSDIYIGLPTFGVLIPAEPHQHTLRYFDGQYSTVEIASGLGVSIEEVEELQALLIQHGMLELLSKQLFAGSDISQVLIQTRVHSELDLLTHRPGINDGGEKAFAERESFTILISGENRFARNLLAALQGVGFTNTRIIPRAQLTPRIEASDVCGFSTRTSDIGKSRSEFAQEIIRNSSIVKSEFLAKADPDLIISTIPIQWDYVQRWMAEGSEHLHINTIIGSHLEIGPLVIPGITPCLRCVALAKLDLGIVEKEGVTAKSSEFPTAVNAYVSGLIAMCVSEYVTTRNSTLLAASYWLDLLTPLSPPDHRYWDFHPDCGCQ